MLEQHQHENMQSTRINIHLTRRFSRLNHLLSWLRFDRLLHILRYFDQEEQLRN